MKARKMNLGSEVSAEPLKSTEYLKSVRFNIQRFILAYGQKSLPYLLKWPLLDVRQIGVQGRIIFWKEF